MQQRSLGATGDEYYRLGLGTMTWGRDTDEHEARDQLMAFAETGGTCSTPPRNTATVRARSARSSATSWPATTWSSRRRPASTGVQGARVTNTSRGNLLRTLDESLRRLGVDHGDLWQVHRWPMRPGGGDAHALDLAVRRGALLRRRLELHRMEDRPGRDLAAGRPGRVPLASTQVEYSLLNRHVEHEIVPAAQALGLGVLPWSPLGRGVLTGKYRTGTPSDSRAATEHFAGFVGAYLDERGRGIVEAVARRRRSRLVSRWRSRSCGYATGPGSPPRSSVPARPRSSRERSASRS